MKTKYEWSNVPKEVKCIATERCGTAHGWNGKPEIMFGGWNSRSCGVTMFYILEKNNPYQGNWQDSLEERPSEND